MASGVSATNPTTPTNQPATVSNSSSTLGKDDFLKLLVTQLQNQDPLQPMDNTQFISQMAQFSALEQMQNMSTSMTQFQATQMIGSIVLYTDDKGAQHYGTVSAVNFADGKTSLVIGDQTVDISKVQSVTQDSSSATATQAATMIGKKITWVDTDGNSQSGVVSSIDISGILVGLKVGDKTVYLSQVTSIANS